jgi:uncharacterized membrane protein YqiK
VVALELKPEEIEHEHTAVSGCWVLIPMMVLSGIIGIVFVWLTT